MKPVDFHLHRPETLAEALDLLAVHGDEAKVLAGGQSLVPLLNFRLARPSHVIDIARLPLEEMWLARDQVTLGSMVRQAALSRLAELPGQGPCPLIAAALPWIGHPPIRTRGTIGGSLAHADPAAELPAVAVALDATFVAVRAGGPGGAGGAGDATAAAVRTIPASDFFQGYITTALKPAELLTEIRFPIARPGTGAAFTEFARRRGDFALVGCAAQVTVVDGVVEDARICLSGVAATPVRRHAAERILRGQQADPELLDAAARMAADGLEPPGDLHASEEYRRHLATVLTRRALDEALRQAHARRPGNGADRLIFRYLAGIPGRLAPSRCSTLAAHSLARSLDISLFIRRLRKLRN